MNTVFADEFSDTVPQHLLHPFNTRKVVKLPKISAGSEQNFLLTIIDHKTNQPATFTVNDAQLNQINQSMEKQRKAVIAAPSGNVSSLAAWGGILLTAVGIWGLFFKKKRR